MKIYNPARRSKFVWRELHNVCHKFDSVEAVKSALYHEFEDEVPDNGDYSLGYFEGKQQKKRWLISQSDLKAMYTFYHGKAQVSLWCDGIEPADTRSSDEDQPNPPKKRKKNDTTKPSEKEDELESVFQRLKAKHEVNYSGPQLRLWARMIVAKTHDDFDKPPNVPMITGVQRTKQKESLSEALTSAAVAVAKVFSPASENKPIAQGYSSPS